MTSESPSTAAAAHRLVDLSEAQGEIIDLIAAGAPLAETLGRIALAAERLVGPARCSILLLDPDGKRLRHAAAPSLPEAYSRAIDGLAIGPKAGSCGTAAFRREPVVARDIAADPLWADFRHLALAHGLRACWSLPIVTGEGGVLGTFALYYAQPREPLESDWPSLQAMARLARLALAQQRKEDALRQSEAEYRRLAENASDVIMRLEAAIDAFPEGFALFDADDRLVLCNELFRSAYPKSADVVVPGIRFEDIVRERARRGAYGEAAEGVDALIAERLALHAAPTGELERRLPDGRWIRLRERRLSDGSSVGVRTDITDLKQREETFRLLFESNPLPMWVVDRETLRFVAVNQRAIEHYGYSRERFLAMTALDIRPEEDCEAFRKVAEERRSGFLRGTRRHLRADGSVIEVDFVVSPLVFGGRPAVLVAVADVTETRRAAERLRRSEERYRLLAENGSDVILHIVPGGPRLYVSPSASHLLGYAPQELLAKLGLDLVHPEDVERVRSEVGALVPDGPGAVVQHRLRHTDGSYVWVEAVMRLVRGDGGRVELISAIRDIRERKRTEEQLADLSSRLSEENRRFDVALENTRHGIAFYDADWHLQVWNRQYTSLYGLVPDALHVGMTLAEVVRASIAAGSYPDGDPEGLVADRLAIAAIPVPHTFRRELAGGRWIETMQQPLPEGGTVVTHTDITERIQYEADLRRAKDGAEAASRTKSEFLATMSHELRTPLNAILGFSEIMRDAYAGPLNEQYRTYAYDIHASGKHLLELINDILDLSKVEVGRLELHAEVLELRDIVSRSCRLVAEKAHNGGISLDVNLADDLPPILADGLRMKQILLNLLSNAVKFTPSGGSVTVSARIRDGDGLEVQVADTGIGMRPEEIPTALEPFRQIDNSTTRRYEGTGLGLPLAKRLVELHGGVLAIESQLGQGTTVCFRIPEGRLVRGGLPDPQDREVAASGA